MHMEEDIWKELESIKNKIKESNELSVEIMENQKALENQLKYMKGDVKALSKLSTDILKVHRIHRDLAKENSKQLNKIVKKLEKMEKKK